MSDLLKAAFLGLVQGLTEFLPISSSAHLEALRRVLDFKIEGLAFDLALHVGTLIAVLIYFRGDIAGIIASPKRISILLRLGVAMLPIVILGFLLKSWREHLPAWAPVAGWTFSGLYLLLITRGRGGTGTYAEAPPRTALGIGAAQALAIFPGVSRSGSTITAGLLCGLSREEAARFSFLLSIIAVALASADKAKDVLKSGADHSSLYSAALVGMPVSFVTGMIAIHLLLRIVRADYFHRFGWYNLGAAAAYGIYLFVNRPPSA